MRVLFVVAAVLQNKEQQILLAQRPAGKNFAGLWEFPGGKIEKEETPENALIRELKEELDISVAQEDLQHFTFITHAYDDFYLVMLVYKCCHFLGEPQPKEGQVLRWVDKRDLGDYLMPEPDAPLIALLNK